MTIIHRGWEPQAAYCRVIMDLVIEWFAKVSRQKYSSIFKQRLLKQFDGCRNAADVLIILSIWRVTTTTTTTTTIEIVAAASLAIIMILNAKIFLLLGGITTVDAATANVTGWLYGEWCSTLLVIGSRAKCSLCIYINKSCVAHTLELVFVHYSHRQSLHQQLRRDHRSDKLYSRWE